MDYTGMKIGFAITGSYCTLNQILSSLQSLASLNADIYPVFSYEAMKDSRFTVGSEFVKKVEDICNRPGFKTIAESEVIGPKNLLDVMVVAPCTGNTLAKLANGIVDTPVLMACKAHLRNNNPLVLSVSTNDALGSNFKNIGILMNTKNIYFVPFKQDNPISKPKSLVADITLIDKSIDSALKGIQIQPVLL